MAKTWFITGASRGLGALIAEQALARGDNVVATVREPASVISRLGSSAKLLAVALDVTDEVQAHAAADAAITRFGRIDILLNNAGFGQLGAVEEATAQEIERVYRTNVFATVIEPVFFRTDFLDSRSLFVSSLRVEDYADTAGAMRSFAATVNHAQPGDPAKLAQALMIVVDAAEPPLRMPFGTDALRRIEAKNAFVTQEIARWRDLCVSTDATAA
jgi:hypothetical protein